jgi:transcriptional regulator with XRE-family HTH domain
MLNLDHVRLARHVARLSQRQLGERIGQDQSYVSRLERGGLPGLTADTLAKLALALGVSADYLLGLPPLPSGPVLRPQTALPQGPMQDASRTRARNDAAVQRAILAQALAAHAASRSPREPLVQHAPPPDEPDGTVVFPG